MLRAMEAAADVLVVGGGVVGLACAAALAREGRSVALVERHAGPGRETSSRNSGVVHAGLYYPPGSRKALLCAEGRERLYARCEALGIPHRRTGKLVVATNERERGSLESIAERARANGAGAIHLIDAKELAAREPLLRSVAALVSPESGIVDAHSLVASLASECRSLGVALAFRTTLEALSRSTSGWRAEVVDPDARRTTLEAEVVVDSAGLECDRVASLAGLDVDALGVRIAPCKGDYFALHESAPRPTTPLVYPVPDGPGLGIHLTTDLAGQRLAGPDATYVDAPSYEVDEGKRSVFAESIRRYLPGLRDEHLAPAYAGVRPKLAGGSGLGKDFVVEECSPHGAPGFVLLAGIESPGLTASLALGARVAEIVRGRQITRS
ncbi:MAG: NAD(P)/FAD-dependent oxidoreductase [Polyangiales bacterium]